MDFSFSDFLRNATHWMWLGAAVCLGFLEVLFGANFFLLWLAVSATSVGLILWVLPGLPWEYQWLIFSMESIACLVFWHYYLKHHPAKTDKPRLNRRSEQYIGRVFTLEEPIVNSRGKIHVEDSSWRVEGEDMPVGTKVRVVDVNGVILKVERLDK